MKFLASFIISIFEKLADKLYNLKGHFNTNSHKTVQFYRTSKVYNISNKKDNIIIGNDTHIRGELLIFAHGGSIRIGEYSFLGEYSKIWSASSVSIGKRVLISHNVNIHDNNSHPLGHEERHEHFKSLIKDGHPSNVSFNEKPIVIHDDVWIGFNATILKGVTIGKGAIISANTLVKEDVPPFVLFAGNPGAIIKQLN